jgi:TQXA domain-containing protein/LPXTG-motif cell wall-anchored protein
VQRSFNAAVRRWSRFAAAVGTGAVVALGLSGVAKAADEPLTGKVHEGPVLGVVLNAKNPQHPVVSVERITLTLKGSEKPVLTYCIDFGHPIDSEKPYTETGWTESKVANLAQVQWILTNSFPSASPEALFKAAGVTLPEGADGEALAYVATQAAIWSFSDADKFALFKLPATGTAGVPQGFTAGVVAKYRAISALYDYLTKNAKAESEPAPLSITPATATGNVGTKVGPFTVNSAVGDVELTATGTAGALVDDKGQAVTKVKNKAKVFVDCKSAGTVKIDGKVKFDVPLGRVFVARRPNDNQKLILAGHAGKEQTASATATCTAVPVLPKTGAPVVGTVAAGFVLLGTGAGLFLVRRRRIRFTV